MSNHEVGRDETDGARDAENSRNTPAGGQPAFTILPHDALSDTTIQETIQLNAVCTQYWCRATLGSRRALIAGPRVLRRTGLSRRAYRATSGCGPSGDDPFCNPIREVKPLYRGARVMSVFGPLRPSPIDHRRHGQVTKGNSRHRGAPLPER